MAIFDQVVEKKLIQPTFVTDYPVAVSPLSRRSNTDPNIVEGLLQQLRQWRTGTVTPDEFETTPDTQTAFDNQDGIGWQALLEGAPAKGWSDAQQRYYDALGRRNTGERWLTAIIQKLWDVAWDLWDHRNNVLHKKDDGVLRQQLQTDIREQVNLGSSTVTAQARPLLRQRLAVLLTARTEVQKAWLLRVVNARARFLRRHTEVLGGYHRERVLMRRFLRRATIRMILDGKPSLKGHRQKVGAMHSKGTTTLWADETQVKGGLRRSSRNYGTWRGIYGTTRTTCCTRKTAESSINNCSLISENKST